MIAGRYVYTNTKREYSTSWDTIEEVKAIWPKTDEEAEKFFGGDYFIEDGLVEWGEYNGKKRNGCPELPELLLGMPIGMYHCPVCGVMCLAGMAHPRPDEPDYAPEGEEPEWQPYELVTGREWPMGYYEKETE